MKKLNNIFWIILVFIFSCKEEIKTTKENAIVKSTKSYQKEIDSCKQFLKEGSIILRTGNDAISSMFAQLNNSDKTFSHCGIAFKINEEWFVFHSIGGEDNPDEKLRKEPFDSFVNQNHNNGFGICQYAIKKEQLNKLKTTVLNWHLKEIPFDMKFDLKTNDHLYCAEMVYKAFNIAFATDSFFSITNHKGFKYVSTDNIFVNKDAQMLCHLIY